VHWLFEIGNALIQRFSGHALWTVPAGTSYPFFGVDAAALVVFAGVLRWI
jgi:hypothetical protein